MASPAAAPVAIDTAGVVDDWITGKFDDIVTGKIDYIYGVVSSILSFLFGLIQFFLAIPCFFFIGPTDFCLFFLGDDFFFGDDATRSLAGGVESSSPNQCHLLNSDGKGPGSDKTQTLTNTNQVQEEINNVVAHMEDRTDFSADHLRSLYSSLLDGFVDSDDEQVKQDMEKAIAETIGSIDTNGDGIIDVWEMEHIDLPRETGEFLFDDVVACTTTNESPEDACVSTDNVLEFINMFYGGAEIISADLAEHIRQMSGADACFSREEFEAAFSPEDDLDTLSAGLSSQPMDLSFVLSMAFGVGTALFVSGLSSPF